MATVKGGHKRMTAVADESPASSSYPDLGRGILALCALQVSTYTATNSVGVSGSRSPASRSRVSHFGVAVEYALHVMTQLARFVPEKPPSARALAEFQGVPTAYLAKIMTQLQKAGLVAANEGKGGGYRLAKPPEQITFLDVADAVEGHKSLFQCTEVRKGCVLYRGYLPKPSGICAIHAVMLAAERRMREQLAQTTIADMAGPLRAKTSSAVTAVMQEWFETHSDRSSGSPRRRRGSNEPGST